MKSFRLVLTALILSLSLVAAPALATCYSTDQSDLWWTNPPGSENGWGFQLVQRCSTIFATMFVYDPTGAPTWYVATMEPNPPGSLVWSGDLYTTTGPWFGTVPYNPALFTGRKVGTMMWTPATVTTGTLSYTVDGVAVTKSVIRQTLVNENYNGHFGGGIHEVVTSCANPAFDGTFEKIGILNIVQNGTAITLTAVPASGPSCTYTGTLSQFGQMGDIVGTYGCADGTVGTFHIVELQVTIVSVNGRFAAATSAPAGCQSTGWFGGLVVTTF
jgi:hypothetical protein